jgi:hypothetical protein
MRSFFLIAGTLLCMARLHAQELFVSTEPASNMARNSLALRTATEWLSESDFKSRISTSIMFGISKNIMLQATTYQSDFYQRKLHTEGASFYGKYRFLNIDNIQKHFRGALYAHYSTIKYPVIHDEINIEGENNGIETGLVFTQLLHKLGLSGSVSYVKSLDNFAETLPGHEQFHDNAHKSIMYTVSSGYRVFPKTYKDYHQANINIYLEFMGDTHPESGRNTLDAIPAIQFIFNSKFRVDLSKHMQIKSSMERRFRDMYMMRLEYNFFNVFKKRSESDSG